MASIFSRNSRLCVFTSFNSPWEQLSELVKPCYYEGARGNKPYDLELMLRIHLIQNLYDLSDEGTRNEIIDSRAFSDFCEVESSNQIPDAVDPKPYP